MNVPDRANRWLGASTAHDIEAVLACYATDLELVASTAGHRRSRTDGRFALSLGGDRVDCDRG
jgi:ketosteroid isomerase-like protein